MKPHQFDELINEAVEAAVAIMRPAIEQAIRNNLAGDKNEAYRISKLVRFVKRTSRYAGDTRYGRWCANGLMPHSKLLKLSKLPVKMFRPVVDAAIAAGDIEAYQDPETGMECYRIPASTASAQAPARAPAQAPTQPPAPPAAPDYGPLDDPAQDAHEWDFATALAKARERDSWY
jgi:hypothetical protein